ncbi:hypothetical protein [Flavobacterium granuli]|uniref:Uncharacterized protein n=1 Tax=Flavobacterium granuli TaxID=280093 RepID=A0A1M5NV98_9FLAO|nr:hypothetical protein [Flavobacterium granuli]PRZ23408.1 hypothetical protein BC624_105130 [Flavobacterium granuli]SHG93388.1 hypothetical protein SAMN05443373_105130 [Flavobacterium granuli]
MKKFLVLLLCLSGVFLSFSQELPSKEQKTNDVIDDLFEKDQIIDEILASLTKYQFLYLSANYNNDTYFSGRDIGIKQYNINPKITYIHFSGIYANISGNYYSELKPKWDLTTASLGYGKSFGKKKAFKYYVSYSRYFYNNDLDNAFSNDVSIGIGIRNNKKTLGTQLSGSYLFGDEQSFQIASISYVTFKLLKTKNTQLDFKPQISIIAGDQTIELARSYVQNGQLITDITKNNVFSLINTQLSLPLEFNVNSFDFQLGYNINFPTAIGDEPKLKNTSFFNFSVAYLIAL